MAKKALNDPAVNINYAQLSSTGRNLNRQALIDQSKVASSHKYGKTEIQTPHPAWVVILTPFSPKSGAPPTNPHTSVRKSILSQPTERLRNIFRPIK